MNCPVIERKIVFQHSEQKVNQAVGTHLDDLFAQRDNDGISTAKRMQVNFDIVQLLLKYSNPTYNSISIHEHVASCISAGIRMGHGETLLFVVCQFALFRLQSHRRNSSPMDLHQEHTAFTIGARTTLTHKVREYGKQWGLVVQLHRDSAHKISSLVVHPVLASIFKHATDFEALVGEYNDYFQVFF